MFHSRRESLLWLATVAVIVAIYSTLFMAGWLTNLLIEHAALEWAFGLGVLLVGLTIILRSIKARKTVAWFAVALAVFAAYLLLFVRLATPAERTHLIEYGALAILIFEALSERARFTRPQLPPAIVAIALSSAIGVIDETVQAALPSRVFDPRDILFNVLAASSAVVSTVSLSWVARRSRQTGA